MRIVMGRKKERNVEWYACLIGLIDIVRTLGRSTPLRRWGNS